MSGSSLANGRSRAVAAAAVLGLVASVAISLASRGTAAARTDITADELKGLSGYGISVTQVDSGTADGFPISADKATEAARSTVSALLSGSSESAPVAVLFGDADYGEDANHDGIVETPSFQEVPAWMVTFSGAKVPSFGRLPAPGQDALPSTYSADVVVFIDAQSGALLESVTI